MSSSTPSVAPTVQYKLSTRKAEQMLKAGQTHVIKAQAGESYRVLKRKAEEGGAEEQLASDVLAQRSGADLQLDYADGTRVTLQDYFTECQAGAGCAVTLAGDAAGGHELNANSPLGAKLADGSALMYAHGSPSSLAGMVSSHAGLEQPLAGLKGEQLTYVPQDNSALVWLAGGAAGLFALAARNDDSGSQPTVQNFVKLSFVGGPALTGNDLSVEVYQADGKTLLSKGKLNADGSVTVDVKDYSGVVVVKLVNAGSAADYLDEATGQGKDLNAQLYTMGVITEPNSTINLNLNVLTTIAYAKAIEAAGGAALSAKQVNDLAKAIGQLFQLDDLLHTGAVATNGGGFNAADGLSAGEKYGAVLAAFSGADKLNAGSVQDTINRVLAGITVKPDGSGAVIKNETQAELVEGGKLGMPAGSSGEVSLIVDTYAPVFSSAGSASVDENGADGALVYTAVAKDPSAFGYSLGGADAAAFSIDPKTGAVTLNGKADYESKSSYTFTVIATDVAGNKSEQTVTVAVKDLDEVAPLFTSGASAGLIAENSGAGQVVYTAQATDGSAIRYSLKDGGDAAAFMIDAATGKVTLKSNPDFVTQPGYTFTVVATDAAGNQSEQTVTLAVQDLDEVAPVVESVAINGASGLQNETLNAGDVLRLTVKMSEATRVDTAGGTPRLALQIGNDTVYATYDSGSGGDTLVFTYTVQAGQTDINGLGIAADGLQLNGGTLTDAAGNAANLGHAAVADQGGYKVDTTAPLATLGVAASSTQVMLEALGKIDGKDSEPQITVLADGSYLVVWTGEVPGNSYEPRAMGGLTSIFVQKFNADGSKASAQPQQLEPFDQANGNDAKPQVLALAGGGHVLTWQGQDAQGVTSIYVQKFDANGTLSIVEKLNAPGRVNNETPQLAGLADGGFVLSWSGRDGDGQTDNSIYVQKFNADGSKAAMVGPLELPGVANGQDKAPQISALGDGGYVVTFQGADSSGKLQVAMQKFNADGSAGILQQLPGMSHWIDFVGDTPQITALGADGSFVVTWYGQDRLMGQQTWLMQKFDAQGVAQLASPLPLQYTQFPAFGPVYSGSAQVEALSQGGGFVVAWSGPGGINPREGAIYVRKFNAAGTPEGLEVMLQAPDQGGGASIDKTPQITALPDGSYVVVWSGQDSGGDFSIYVQKFNADGTTTGHALQKLEPAGMSVGNDEAPQVKALGADGGFVVSWSGNDNGAGHSQGYDGSVFVQQFGADGKPLPANPDVPVRSSEAGTAYLVHGSVTVTDEASLKAAIAQGLAKSVAVSANTDAFISKDGLPDGSYKLYTADAAGNVSLPSSNSVMVAPVPLNSGTLFVRDDGVYLDAGGAGTAGGWDAGDAKLASDTGAMLVVDGLSDGSGKVINFGGGDWEIQFLSIKGPKLDLSGFGAGDVLLVDMRNTLDGNVYMDQDLGPLGSAGAYWAEDENDDGPGHFAVESHHTGGGIDATLKVIGEAGEVRAEYMAVGGAQGALVLATGLAPQFDFTNQMGFLLYAEG